MKTLTLLFAIFLSGCLTKPAQVKLSPVGNGITRMATDIDSATSSVDAAKPHADDVGNAHLTDATTSLKDAKAQVSTTNKALNDAQTAANKLQADDDKTHEALTIERGHWVGYRTRVLARWIIGIGAALWLTIGVLFIINSISPIPWIGWVIVEIANALPFFNPWMWIETYLKAKQAKTEVK